MPVAEAGADVTICANTSKQIGATPVAGYTYSWYPSTTLNSSTVANPVASPVGTITKYTVTVTDLSGCKNIDSVIIVMMDQAFAFAGTDAEICRGENAQLGTGLTEGQTYSWSPSTGLSDSSISNPTAMPDSTTNYTVTVSFEGCAPVTDNVLVIVHQLPDANAGKDDTIMTGSSIQLVATGGIQYHWAPSSGLDHTDLYNPVTNPDSTTTYVAEVRDIFGCVKTDTVKITVLDFTSPFWLPNAFSPDGDGRNDILYVRGKGFVGFEFMINNRLGEVVFYSKNIEEGWNGRTHNNGAEMPEGAYLYVFKATSLNKEVINAKGLVNLIR